MGAFTPHIVGTSQGTKVRKPPTGSGAPQFWSVGGASVQPVPNPGTNDCIHRFDKIVVADRQPDADALATQLDTPHVQPAATGSTAFSSDVTLQIPDSSQPNGFQEQHFNFAIVTDFHPSGPGLMADEIRVFQSEAEEPDTFKFGRLLCTAIRQLTADPATTPQAQDEPVAA